MEDPARPGGRTRTDHPQREAEENQTDWPSRRRSPPPHTEPDAADADASDFVSGLADLSKDTFPKVGAPAAQKKISLPRFFFNK